MASSDTLATLGQKLTDLFSDIFVGGNVNVSLVFLPFAAPVPVDIVQNGIVNPLRLTAFLVANFDAPYLVSAQQCSVHGMDTSYGAASQIYSTAVMLARAAAPPDSPAESRINAEIMMARKVMDPSGPAIAMASTPDDWVVPSTMDYWTTFNSGQQKTGPASAPPPTSGDAQPRAALNMQLWSIKPEAALLAPVTTLEEVHQANPVSSRAVIAEVALNHPKILALNPAAVAAVPITPMVKAQLAPSVMQLSSAQPTAPARHITLGMASAAMNRFNEEPVDPSELPPQLRPRPGDRPRIPIDVPPFRPPPPPPPPAPSSSVTIHFEYTAVTIGYMAAGLPIWNGVFLADQSWYIPGMARGALLPSPATVAGEAGPALSYGLPTTLVVVRNVTINVKWSGQEQSQLGDSGGFLGPFSLSGASSSVNSDGSWTYSRQGMQVIALLCNHLPVLPPIDAPDLPPQTEGSTTSNTPTDSSTSAGSTPAPTG